VDRIADQARRTAKAARAGWVANAGGEPGVLDLTPLRELLPELAEELRKVRAGVHRGHSGLDAKPTVMRGCYARMLIARAITSPAMPRDTAASMIISSLAHGLIAEMSVGLNAVAVQKPSDR